MKKQKLEAKHDDLTRFNKFIIATVGTLSAFQAYRQLWMAFDGAMGLLTLSREPWYQGQYIIHIFLINPGMDLCTFLGMLYLFHCLYLANLRLHEKKGEEPVVVRLYQAHANTREVQNLLAMSDEEYQKRI